MPRLRFPEFWDDGDWEEEKLENLGEFTGGGTPSKSNRDYWNGNIPWISSSDVVDESIYQVNISRFISEEALRESATKLVPPNSILLVSRVGVGKLAITVNPVCTSQDFTNFTPNKDNLIFLAYLLKSSEKSLISLNQGTSIRGFTREDIGQFKICYPCSKEQQKIADCLAAIDALITAQTQKRDALKAHKKGLMQQLFPTEGETQPQLRFPAFRDDGDWNIDLLGNKNISSFVKDRVTLEHLCLDTYVSTENLLSDYAGITRASRLPPSGSFTQYKKGDVLISNIRPYLKKVWSADKGGASSNDVIVVRSGEKLDGNFLTFILKNDAFISYVMKGAKGVKMPRGDISSMKDYPIAFPKQKEQQKIADCLTSLDALITAQTQKNDALKTHKKGLMQQLFPAMDEVAG